MIVRADQGNIEEIYDYIGQHREECLYLYVNLRRYGVDNPSMSVWLDKENNKILGVYLKYFECLHFFTKESEYQLHTLLSMITQQNPQVIFMPKHIGQRIEEDLSPLYVLKYMEIMSTNELRHIDNPDGVERAGRSDIARIVEFLMDDTEYTNVYQQESVYNQFLHRYDDGFTRFHYILRDGKIVACEGTNAELDDIAIIGGLLTSPGYRGQGLGSKVLQSIWDEILSEGKQGFSFVENPVSKRLHNRLGINTVGAIAKFYKCSQAEKQQE